MEVVHPRSPQHAPTPLLAAGERPGALPVIATNIVDTIGVDGNGYTPVFAALNTGTSMDTSTISYQLAKIVEQLEKLNESLIPLGHLCDCDVELMEVVDEC